MKTIKQAAYEYAIDNSFIGKETIIYNAFIAGTEFANRWISVDDELPETNKKERGIFYSDYVLIKADGYEHHFVGYYVNACDDEFFDFISEITSKSIKQTDITYWRPIEYK